MNKRIIAQIVTVLVIALAVFVIVRNYQNNQNQYKTTAGISDNSNIQNPSANDSANDHKISAKTDLYEITAIYPTEILDKNNVMATFVQDAVNKKKEEWKTGGEAYNQMLAFKKEFPDSPEMQYQLDIQYTKYVSKKFGAVSYVFTLYELTGGAHGNTAIVTFAFNGDGPVAIDSLIDFNNNKDIALSRLTKIKLMSTLGDYANEDMVDSGLGLAYLKADGITLDKKKCSCDGFFFGSNFQNFVIKDSGITFIMSQYQVAPYVAGMPEVTFSLSELQKYLVVGAFQ